MRIIGKINPYGRLHLSGVPGFAVLATGYWVDNGGWYDSEPWNDGV